MLPYYFSKNGKNKTMCVFPLIRVFVVLKRECIHPTPLGEGKHAYVSSVAAAGGIIFGTIIN